MISIFAKPAFLNINPSQPLKERTKPIRAGHVMRVSSMIRGDQIADVLGAKLNPTEGFENDVCVYVKPMVQKGDDFEFKGKSNYLDIIDGHNLGHLAKKHPEIGIITCSQADFDIMSKELSNKIYLIPQHHCNFERKHVYRSGEIKKIGIIGEENAFAHLPSEMRGELAKRGIQLVTFSKFFKREDIINFYLDIDLQIVWRPYKKILSNPLKIVNASAFSLPTIALDEPAFQEVSGCYAPVKTFEGFLKELDTMIYEPAYYHNIREHCEEQCERYHIDNIARMYKELP